MSAIVILGHSGSGKTTIIDLICGLLVLKKGEILVDGKNIVNNFSGWQKKISYVH